MMNNEHGFTVSRFHGARALATAKLAFACIADRF
jgi:hypothetical protein